MPPGAVLIVGSGQTGCQLAEELHQAGRKVILSCGRCPWAPRRMGGQDLVWWVVESGWWQRTPDQLPSPAARLTGNPHKTGHVGANSLHTGSWRRWAGSWLSNSYGSKIAMLIFLTAWREPMAADESFFPLL